MSTEAGFLAGSFQLKDGIFGELFHVNEADANLTLLPDSIPVAEASMIADMVPTGFHGSRIRRCEARRHRLLYGIGPRLMAVADANHMGASHTLAVGSRKDCANAARGYGATDIINYKNGDIVEQVLDKTDGKGVDKVCIAGGDVNTMQEAIKMVKPRGIIGNVNYLGKGEFVTIPRIEWGCGMSNKSSTAV